MSGRRASLPGAAELFRPTRSPHEPQHQRRDAQGARTGTGRQRHSTKITVYVSDEELLALEQARLELRAGHGLGVDRGRIVREAVAVLLEDLDERGGESLLVRRLRVAQEHGEQPAGEQQAGEHGRGPD